MASKTDGISDMQVQKEESKNKMTVSPKSAQKPGDSSLNPTTADKANNNGGQQQKKQQQPADTKRQAVYKKIGQYSLIKEIGHGSFARVYKGRTEVNGVIEEFAIKMIAKQDLREENQALIDKEINILLKLNHPNIIRLKDFKKTTNNWYLIFEFCELGDLDQYIKEKFGGRFPLKLTIFFLQQLADAFQEIRRLKIVHRDLKLANILINKDFIVKLGDFGFAKHFEDNTLLKSYCGTPITMAPEILKREKYNEKCDIWSLGIILYQMIFGKAPFDPKRGASISDLIDLIDKSKVSFEGAEITPELKELISRMLVVDINKRLSFEEFFVHPCVQTEYLNSFSIPVGIVGVEEKIKERKTADDKKREDQKLEQIEESKAQMEEQPQSQESLQIHTDSEQLSKDFISKQNSFQSPQTLFNQSSQQQSQSSTSYALTLSQQIKEENALEQKEIYNLVLEYIHQKLHSILKEETSIYIKKVTEYREIADQLAKDKNTEFGESCAWSALLLILMQMVKILEYRIEIQLNQEVFTLPLPKSITDELKELSKILNEQIYQIPIQNVDQTKNLDAYIMLFGNLLHYADYCLLNEFLNSPQIQLKYYKRCMKLCEFLLSLRFSVFSRLVISLSEPSIGVSRQDIQKILQIAPLNDQLLESSSLNVQPKKMALIKALVEIVTQPMNSNFIEAHNIQDKKEQINIQYEIYLGRYEACNNLVNAAKSP